MESLKRISTAETENYIELSIYDDKVCTKAIAFTLTPSIGIYPEDAKSPSYGTLWEEVTYYGDEFSTSNSPLSPLEFMYKEWDMSKDIDPVKDLGDERDLNV
jgi:hypothetical protein